MKPVLEAVIEKADGVYETVQIDLGDAQTVVEGQTYRYTVENLPDDGLYTFTCEVKDMAGNGMTQVVLDDGEKLDCDLVIVAAGVRSAVAGLEESGPVLHQPEWFRVCLWF